MGLLRLIDKIHTGTNSLIKNRFPLLSLYYYTKPRSWWHWRGQPVGKLLNGNLKNIPSKQSVIFFMVHKSASTFFDRYLKDLAAETGHFHIDINGYFGTSWKEWLEKRKDLNFTRRVFKPKGFIYGPLRNYVKIENFEAYPAVLVLRDPRDVLTSQYFSIKNSHPLVTAELIKRRQFAKDSGIDEHVLSQADRFVNTYNEYLEHVYGKKNVLFIKYEELISDFKNCLSKINSHCGFNLTPGQMQALDRSDKFKAKKEDQQVHVRKITAGDHKEKLKPETISILNAKFGDILKKLDYKIN